MVLMIVCVCNRINCKGVREALDAGASSPAAVQAHHGCRFNCGKCSNTLVEMISEARADVGADFAAMAAE